MATFQRAADGLKKRTSASSAIAPSASNHPATKMRSAGVARPHFLIECENLQIKTAPRALPGAADLPHFVQLTRREREIVQLICDGQSNQEIADETVRVWRR
jgi:DNA-binding NarL/FixJ family response regulator